MKKDNIKNKKIHFLYMDMCIFIFDDDLYSFQHDLLRKILMDELYGE